MAVATTVIRPGFNRSLYAWINLKVASTTGITPNMVLTVGGDLALTALHELPNNIYKCRVTTLPRGKGHLLVRAADTVTG